MNTEVANKLFWIAMHVLHDAAPSVPPRGEPLVSVLTSGEPSWERARLRGTRRRHNEWWLSRGRSEEWSGEGSESEGYSEGDEEESSEEGSIA